LIPLYAFALLDDAFQVHERLGRRTANALALQPIAGLRPQDLGELTVWMVFGSVLLAGTLAGFARSAREDRNNGLLLLGAFASLVLFAVVADMVHIVVGGMFGTSDLLFAAVEDGGEQIVLTATCGLIVLIWRELRSREAGDMHRVHVS
jgi:hypothetical protein